MTSRPVTSKILIRNGSSLDLLVGDRVRVLRQRRRLSRRALGEAIGAPADEIGRIEAGLKHLGAARLLSIAEALDVDVEALFESDGFDEVGRRPIASRSLH